MAKNDDIARHTAEEIKAMIARGRGPNGLGEGGGYDGGGTGGEQRGGSR